MLSIRRGCQRDAR